MVIKTFYLETFGCQMNEADSELAISILLEAGYVRADSSDDADLVLYNTCSVRSRAEQKVFNKIGELRHSRRGNVPLIGLMGCVAQLEGSKIFNNNSFISLIIGTRAISRLPELIARVEKGERGVSDLGERTVKDVWSQTLIPRKSNFVAFVPVIEGCNKFCTYCIVPYSRGREVSRLATEVVKEVLQLKEKGFKEIQLIGQNVNSYQPKESKGLEGYKGATPFSRLLRAVAATGMPRIKFTTSFPRDFHEDIVSAMEETENICNWVHLPFQAGSDRILRLMRRGYTVADYQRRVETIKSSRRRIALTSDVIVGFPTETDDEFEGTLRLVQSTHFDMLYIFKYSERPGTPAAKIRDNVPQASKTERFLRLESIQKKIQAGILDGYVGSEVEVLVEGASARSPLDLTGHTTCNKVVNFTADQNIIGSVVNISITEAKSNSLYGKYAEPLRT